jgi:S-formylglutathione hydrolase FrmB
MKRPGLCLLALLLMSGFVAAATVNTIEIASTAMHTSYKAAVVLPASYNKSKASYPVLYLLHGASGHFSNWLTATPDKMLVEHLADQYNIIIVLPEGETDSWYVNSPVDKQSQFETYITQEVIVKIDNSYRTIHDRKGRVISGLSIGGHGALFLSARHPDLFCAAGSMSGALDLSTSTWLLTPQYISMFNKNLQKIIGDTSNTALYNSYSVAGMAEQIKNNGVRLIFDCGVDDFLVATNRELHRRLVANHTAHDYTERPGGHSWEYWQNSLPYHLLFFYTILKGNGSIIAP